MMGLLDDKKGQAIPVEYILIFTISILFFGIIMFAFNSVVDHSSKQAIQIEFTDLGNEVSSAITKTYLTAPITGNNNLTLDIPTHIAGSGYFIEISSEAENPFRNEVKAIKLRSMRKDVTTYVPLNSIDGLIQINGSVSSASGKILITCNTTNIMIY